jgi:hypothetical protein
MAQFTRTKVSSSPVAPAADKKALAAQRLADSALQDMQRALHHYGRVVDLALHHKSLSVRTKARETQQKLAASTRWTVGMPKTMLRDKQELDALFAERSAKVTYAPSEGPSMQALALRNRHPKAAVRATQLVQKPSTMARLLGRLLPSRRHVVGL